MHLRQILLPGGSAEYHTEIPVKVRYSSHKVVRWALLQAGVNLRIYFKENDQELSRFSAERSRIVKALIRAKTHLEYEINLDRTQTLSNLETALAKSREKLTELQKASKNLQRATAALQATAKSEVLLEDALKYCIMNFGAPACFGRKSRCAFHISARPKIVLGALDPANCNQTCPVI